MKKQVASAILRFILVFILLDAAAMIWLLHRARSEGGGNQMVLLNEIAQLTTDAEGYNPAAEELKSLRGQLQAAGGAAGGSI